MLREQATDPVRHKALSPWLGCLAIMFAFAVSAALSWRKWPDLEIDFGMQLYLPWQISTGKVLYRDMAYLTGGPFSQYYNAALFKLFGVSFLVIIIANLVIAAALLLLVYRRFLAVSDSWTATAICLGIILVFAFGQDADIGNYNFITPYCHEIWHGLVLSIVAVSSLSDWMLKERIRWAAAAGVCAGLVFMTKPEVFAALAVTVLAAFAMFQAFRGRAGFVWKSAAVFLLSGFAPLLAAFCFFLGFEDDRAALRSVAFAWVPLLETSAAQNGFYRWCMGLDTPGEHLRAMLAQFAGLAAAVGVCAWVLRRKLDSPANRLLAIGCIALLAALASGLDWSDCGRSLPLLSITLCLVLLVKRRFLSGERPLEFPLLWCVFGLALLAKLGLFSRVWHYGFALAMPAFASAVYLLLWALPLLLERYGVHRRWFRVAIGLVLLVGFLRLFVQSQFIYRDKTAVVGQDGDRIIVNLTNNPANATIRDASLWLATNATSNATLAVLPEGVMLNYLTRRANPTHNLVWNPVELEVFGQTAMTADFERHPPDYIVLAPRETAEFGVEPFGRQKEFGLDLIEWIHGHYEIRCRFANPATAGSEDGTLWKHTVTAK